jgi:hypothetical protein
MDEALAKLSAKISGNETIETIGDITPKDFVAKPIRTNRRTSRKRRQRSQPC